MRLSEFTPLVRAAAGILSRRRVLGPPIEANLSLTSRCNIRCIHCYFYSPQLQGSNLFELRTHAVKDELSEEKTTWQNMDLDSVVAGNIVDKLGDMGVQRLLFSGSGEPLLHPDFLDLSERAKRRNIACTVNTNGILLDDKTVDRLVDMEFDRLRVTTLAGSQDVYARTHPGIPGQTLENIKANLMRLVEKKAALGAKKPLVQLITIVITENCDDLQAFIRMAEEVQVDQVHFRPLSDLGDAGLRHLALSSQQQARVRDELLGIKMELEKKNIKHNIDHYLRISRKRLDTAALYRLIPCYYGWFAIRIEVNGLVYPCCRCFIPLGETDGTDLDEIWRSDTYREFREEAIKINATKTSVKGCGCNNCPHYTVNLRAYRFFHPLKTRSKNLFSLDFIEDRDI